jgi:hypothetical protein
MRKRIIVVLLATIFVLVVLGYLARPSNRLLLTIFPPSDLYEHFAEIEVPKEKLNSKINFNLSRKYIGDYLVGIYLENPPPYGMPIGDCGKITLLFNGNDFRRNYSDWRGRFGGPGSAPAGVILGAYTVPKDISRGQDLNATIELHIKEVCFDKYGPLKFYIRRAGDL